MCLLCILGKKLSIKPLNAIIGVLLSPCAHAVCRKGDGETAQCGDILDLQALFSQPLGVRSLLRVLIVYIAVRYFDYAAKLFC